MKNVARPVRSVRSCKPFASVRKHEKFTLGFVDFVKISASQAMDGDGKIKTIRAAEMVKY